jgi:hypothetical protein
MIRLLFEKLFSMSRESVAMIRKEKAYFLAPIILMLILVAIFIIHVGPAVVLAFIYAGI